MSTYLYACGFNGFSKLSSIKLKNVDETSKLQLEVGDISKILHPFLLIQLRESDNLHNIAVTWSRTGITFKRKDNSFFSIITGFCNKESATFNPPHVLENHIVVAATDKDILLKKPELKTKHFILKDGSSNIESLQLDDQVEKALINGGYQDYFICFDGNFGNLTGTNCMQQNVGNAKEHLQFCRITSSIIIKEMSCGKEHVILLDENGCIFSYGGGSKGQLGHNTVESKLLPTLIDALHGLHIKSISAGGWHSVAMSDIGDLYTWGWNESGQLGLSSDKKLINEECSVKTVTEPYCVDFSSDLNVVSVSCGSRHTVFLTSNGEVFASGWNAYGQLGLGDTINRWNFSKLDAIKNMIYLNVFAGQWTTFFLCEHA